MVTFCNVKEKEGVCGKKFQGSNNIWSLLLYLCFQIGSDCAFVLVSCYYFLVKV